MEGQGGPGRTRTWQTGGRPLLSPHVTPFAFSSPRLPSHSPSSPPRAGLLRKEFVLTTGHQENVGGVAWSGDSSSKRKWPHEDGTALSPHLCSGQALRSLALGCREAAGPAHSVSPTHTDTPGVCQAWAALWRAWATALSGPLRRAPGTVWALPRWCGGRGLSRACRAALSSDAMGGGSPRHLRSAFLQHGQRAAPCSLALHFTVLTAGLYPTGRKRTRLLSNEGLSDPVKS